MALHEFDFSVNSHCDLFIAAGGFEKRALSFVRRVNPQNFRASKAILLRYQTQHEDNEPGYKRLQSKTSGFAKDLITVDVDIEVPDRLISSLMKVMDFPPGIPGSRSAIIDVSGMAHVVICCCLRSLDRGQFKTKVVYSEARDYYPRRNQWTRVVQAVQKRDFSTVAKYLQTAGLKDIQIPIDFRGNLRPGVKTCLFILPGYEPNRIQGLLDEYAPNAVLTIFGRSPHKNLQGRQDLSRKLHMHAFEGWRQKEIDGISTLDVVEILQILENEYQTLRSEYDIAVASQCSKMQTVASYLFWRQHPEVQLVFTSAVRIEQKRYSWGEGKTYTIDLDHV